MQENKSKLPPTPVSEILPRGNYFNENEDDLQRLLPSNMEIILFLRMNLFFLLYWRFPSTHCVIKTVI